LWIPTPHRLSMTGLRCSTRRVFQSTVFTADHDCNSGPGSFRRYLQYTAMGLFWREIAARQEIGPCVHLQWPRKVISGGLLLSAGRCDWSRMAGQGGADGEQVVSLGGVVSRPGGLRVRVEDDQVGSQPGEEPDVASDLGDRADAERTVTAGGGAGR